MSPPNIRGDFDISGETDLDGVGIPLPPPEIPATKSGSNKLKERQKGSGPKFVARGVGSGSSRDGDLEAHGVSCDTIRHTRSQWVENPGPERAENMLRRIMGTEQIHSLTCDRLSVVVFVDDMESIVVGENRMMGGSLHNRTIELYEEVFARMAGCWQRAIYLASLTQNTGASLMKARSTVLGMT